MRLQFKSYKLQNFKKYKYSHIFDTKTIIDLFQNILFPKLCFKKYPVFLVLRKCYVNNSCSLLVNTFWELKLWTLVSVNYELGSLINLLHFFSPWRDRLLKKTDQRNPCLQIGHDLLGEKQNKSKLNKYTKIIFIFRRCKFIAVT